MIALETLIVIAGGLQMALALASLAIPRELGWPRETAALGPLTRRVFWVYAAYIWTAHVAFAFVSVLQAGVLAGGSPLARTVSGFIALWWGARIVIQFAWFHAERPPGRRYVLAEGGLLALFIYCAAVYAAAAAR